METGTLYIVATPIGNLEDITLRAIRILREVDLIAAEDTRHTRKLLSHLGISKPVTSYFDHNQNLKGEYILSRLEKGESVALVSDAGTPCIADPGYQLVRDAAAAGVLVVPIPGPSALAATVSVSGLPSDRIAFEGFPPNRQGKRRERLAALVGESRLLVFYESPHRIHETIVDMLEIFGERQALVAREVSKIHEELLRGTLKEVADSIVARDIKGELVILIAPARGVEIAPVDWRPLLQDSLLRQGMTVKDAVKTVVAETGVPKSQVYAEALRIKK